MSPSIASMLNIYLHTVYSDEVRGGLYKSLKKYWRSLSGPQRYKLKKHMLSKEKLPLPIKTRSSDGTNYFYWTTSGSRPVKRKRKR